jgi:hypothetical protein
MPNLGAARGISGFSIADDLLKALFRDSFQSILSLIAYFGYRRKVIFPWILELHAKLLKL